MVCAIMTEEFLSFSQEAGNDLSTPIPEYNFPGLKPGDCWCLCAGRWQEAFEAGMAPQVKLEACEESPLELISLNDLKAHADCRLIVSSSSFETLSFMASKLVDKFTLTFALAYSRQKPALLGDR